MSADKPNPYVYDITTPEGDIQKHFKAHIDLLFELSCYGSNLLPRCFNSRDQHLEDAVIVGCF